MRELLVGDVSLYRAYRDEIEGDRLVRSCRTASLVVIGLSTAFIALDWIAFPEIFGKLLSVRLSLNAVLAAIYVRFAKTQPVPSAFVGCLAIGTGLIAVIEPAGGLLGEYYVGLVLLFVGMPVLMPFSARQAGVLVSMLLVVLAGLPLLEPAAIEWRTYMLHLFFPAAAAVESVASCAMLDRTRFSDFKRRREVEQARDGLKQLDIEKSRFTANVHHELRTPLTLMLAPIETMMSGDFGDVSDLQNQYLRTMHSNGLRLLKLINNLLDLAKIESDQLCVIRRPTRIAQVVDQLVTAARPLAEQKGVELESVDLAALPEICVDPEAMDKVIVNLVGNALKFTDAGGRIEVRGETVEDGGVHLWVADTGIGIPEDQLGRIFERFAQVDNSSTRKYEGTGIGLALVKELVDLHGGRVWAESEGPGAGTQMHLILPAGEADVDRGEEVLQTDEGTPVALGDSVAAMTFELEFAEHNRDAMRVSEIEGNVQRNDFADLAKDQRDPLLTAPDDAPEVLICEDNADMRRLLTFLIGQEFRVRVASNGREGLECMKESVPDLVLTDVMMPEMSGTELCREIKANPDWAGVPVVLVTSKAEREMKIEGLELGADDYVTKPFHPRELLARVRSLVKLRRLQEELAIRNASLKSTNEELRVAMQDLREAGVQLVQSERLAAVGELAAGIAHEVNNPVNFAMNSLRTLRGYVSDIQDVTETVAAIDLRNTDALDARLRELEKLKERLHFKDAASELAELIDIAAEGLDRTHRLVSDLRDFAAPGDSKVANVDLVRGLRTTAQLVGHHLREANVELRMELPDRLPAISGDPRALNQVFLNLFKNATEALEGRGGSISVSARYEEGSVVVQIQDNGPGIARELLPRVFEPFYSTKEAGRGTGLGLSISRRIIAEHNGSIDVRSIDGEGATFIIRLPVQGESRET